MITALKKFKPNIESLCLKSTKLHRTEDAKQMKVPEAGTEKTVEVVISGHVQHVGFRACVRNTARNLSVRGTVRNLEDGRVAINATAEAVIIEKFLSSLHECPRAQIRDIEISDGTIPDCHDFMIVRDGRLPGDPF